MALRIFDLVQAIVLHARFLDRLRSRTLRRRQSDSQAYGLFLARC